MRITSQRKIKIQNIFSCTVVINIHRTRSWLVCHYLCINSENILAFIRSKSTRRVQLRRALNVELFRYVLSYQCIAQIINVAWPFQLPASGGSRKKYWGGAWPLIIWEATTAKRNYYKTKTWKNGGRGWAKFGGMCYSPWRGLYPLAPT